MLGTEPLRPLFSSVENANVEFQDPAEQRVLWDIEGMLEAVLAEPFDAKYDELLARARANVRDSME